MNQLLKGHKTNVPFADTLLGVARSRRVSEWNSGFMYKEGFSDGRRFSRFCDKVNDVMMDYFCACFDKHVTKSVTLKDVMHSLLQFAGTHKPIDFLEEKAVDWRFNAPSIVGERLWNFENLNNDAFRGMKVILMSDEIYDEVFTYAYSEACLQWLHYKLISSGIDETNFCIVAVPCSDAECTLFAKLLCSILWADCLVYSLESIFPVLPHTMMEKTAQNRAEKLEEDVEALNETIADLRETIDRKDEALRTAENTYKAIADDTIRKAEKKMADKVRVANKRADLAEKESERLRERLSELKERILIDEEASADTDNTEGISALNYDSKIVFIVSPPKNGRVERTFEALKQRLPNCRFVNKPEDCISGMDCYVMLTKYMIHHSLYNATHDMLLRRGWPCIHSANQNADLIINDIFTRTRYNAPV